MRLPSQATPRALSLVTTVGSSSLSFFWPSLGITTPSRTVLPAAIEESSSCPLRTEKEPLVGMVSCISQVSRPLSSGSLPPSRCERVKSILRSIWNRRGLAGLYRRRCGLPGCWCHLKFLASKLGGVLRLGVGRALWLSHSAPSAHPIRVLELLSAILGKYRYPAEEQGACAHGVSPLKYVHHIQTQYTGLQHSLTQQHT